MAEGINIEDTRFRKRPVRLASIASEGADPAAAPDTVDSVAVAVGDRILVNNSTSKADNGIYQVVTVGTGTDGVWSRTGDADDNTEIFQSMRVYVAEGTNWANTWWSVSTDDPIDIGTDTLDFVQEASGSQYQLEVYYQGRDDVPRRAYTNAATLLAAATTEITAGNRIVAKLRPGIANLLSSVTVPTSHPISWEGSSDYRDTELHIGSGVTLTEDLSGRQYLTIKDCVVICTIAPLTIPAGWTVEFVNCDITDCRVVLSRGNLTGATDEAPHVSFYGCVAKTPNQQIQIDDPKALPTVGDPASFEITATGTIALPISIIRGDDTTFFMGVDVTSGGDPANAFYSGDGSVRMTFTRCLIWANWAATHGDYTLFDLVDNVASGPELRFHDTNILLWVDSTDLDGSPDRTCKVFSHTGGAITAIEVGWTGDCQVEGVDTSMLLSDSGGNPPGIIIWDLGDIVKSPSLEDLGQQQSVHLLASTTWTQTSSLALTDFPVGSRLTPRKTDFASKLPSVRSGAVSAFISANAGIDFHGSIPNTGVWTACADVMPNGNTTMQIPNGSQFICMIYAVMSEDAGLPSDISGFFGFIVCSANAGTVTIVGGSPQAINYASNDFGTTGLDTSAGAYQLRVNVGANLLVVEARNTDVAPDTSHIHGKILILDLGGSATATP